MTSTYYTKPESLFTAIGLGTFITGLFIGFLMGWFANDTSEARTVCIFISILLIIAMKYGIRGCADIMVSHSELVRVHREDEAKLAEQQEKAAMAQVKAMKETAKTEIEYAFTSEDFNETAQAMIQKMVREAKRSKTKVTGESLVTAVLKGIR